VRSVLRSANRLKRKVYRKRAKAKTSYGQGFSHVRCRPEPASAPETRVLSRRRLDGQSRSTARDRVKPIQDVVHRSSPTHGQMPSEGIGKSKGRGKLWLEFCCPQEATAMITATKKLVAKDPVVDRSGIDF